MKRKKIYLAKGLPGSGKSTLIKEMIKAEPFKYCRINRDELREMFSEPWSKKAEKLAIQARDVLIISALENGLIPIVDDTNLSMTHHQAHIKEAINKWMYSEIESGNGWLDGSKEFDDKFEFEVIDLTNVDLMECIERDRERGQTAHLGRSVGQNVILKLAERYNIC